MLRVLLGTALVATAVLASAQTSADREALARYAAGVKPRKEVREDRVPVLTGKPAPPLRVSQWLNVSPGFQAGSGPMLLDFWATSCPPCVAAFPRLQALDERFAAEGLRVLTLHGPEAVVVEKGLAGFNTYRPQPADRVLPDFLRRRGVRLPVGVDRGDATFAAYKPQGVPLYVLVDRRGIVRYESHRLPTEAQIAEMLRR